MDYKSVAEQILQKAGGAANIEKVSYCTTRLRFRLVDPAKMDKEGIKQIKGVLGLAESNGQQQVIIGADVENVYKAFISLGSFHENGTSEAPKEKESYTPAKIIGKGIEFIAGCVSPALPVIIAAGLVQAIISILTTFFGLSAENNTVIFLSALGNAGFYFLPVLLGFSGAKRIGCNPYMGAFLGSILVYPELASLISAGTMTVFSIPIYAASYSSTVFPMVISVFALKLGEWIGDKICPKFIKTMGKPLISILIAAPITLCLLAPLGAMLGQVIADLIQWISNGPAFIMLAILGFINPFIVVTGMNVGLIPIAINNVSALGYDIVLTVSGLGSNIASGGAALGVALKTKNPQLRETAVTTGITALFGVTEPATYGVNLPLKKPLIAQAIGGCAAGIYAGLAGLKCYGICAPGICALPLYFTGGSGNVIHYFITAAIGFAVAFLSVQFIGFDEPVSEAASPQPADPSIHPEETITAPVTGTVVEISTVNDPVFSSVVIGPGVGIIPKSDTVYAPFDGTVVMVPETKHALGLSSAGGAELLIHVGIDTVTFHGEHFEALVKPGDHFKAGDPLLKFDREAIEKQGFDPTVVIILSNAGKYTSVKTFTGPAEETSKTIMKIS